MPEIWSDDDLDRALAELHAEVSDDTAALARARTTLLAAAGSTEQEPVRTGAVPAVSPVTPLRADRRRGSPPHWGRWSAAAAAVALVTGGLVVVRSLPDEAGRPAADNPPVSTRPSTPAQPDRWVVGASAAAGLVYSADRVGRGAAVPGPGEYLKVSTHSWAARDIYLIDRGAGEFRFLAETLTQVWIPADRNQEWVWRSAETGRRKWQRGTEAKARAAGVPIETVKPEVRRARCGDWFAAAEGRPVCSKKGNWEDPTPEWIADLPRDPTQLLQRLKTDAVKNGRGDAELLVMAVGVLRGGLLPADVRSALYRALALLPGLVVTEKAANLDGRTGVAYGIVDKELGSRQDIIVDPRTGEFIGERESWRPGGTGWANTRQYSSVTTAVVARAGG